MLRNHHHDPNSSAITFSAIVFIFSAAISGDRRNKNNCGGLGLGFLWLHRVKVIKTCVEMSINCCFYGLDRPGKLPKLRRFMASTWPGVSEQEVSALKR